MKLLNFQALTINVKITVTVEQKTKVQEYLTKNFQPDLLFESINPIIYLGNKDEDISLILDALKKFLKSFLMLK